MLNKDSQTHLLKKPIIPDNLSDVAEVEPEEFAHYDETAGISVSVVVVVFFFACFVGGLDLI